MADGRSETLYRDVIMTVLLSPFISLLGSPTEPLFSVFLCSFASVPIGNRLCLSRTSPRAELLAEIV